MSVPAYDVVDAVKARVAVLAPSLDDEKALASLDSPPRYVWVLKEVITKEPQGTGTEAAPSRRALYWDWFRFEVHCWGDDRDAAFELRRGVLKSLRELLGAGAKIGKTTLFGEASYVTCGVVVVLEVTIPSPVFDAPIGTEPDTTTGTAIATDVVFDVPIGTPGDGGLTTGDD